MKVIGTPGVLELSLAQELGFDAIAVRYDFRSDGEKLKELMESGRTLFVNCRFYHMKDPIEKNVYADLSGFTAGYENPFNIALMIKGLGGSFIVDLKTESVVVRIDPVDVTSQSVKTFKTLVGNTDSLIDNTALAFLSDIKVELVPVDEETFNKRLEVLKMVIGDLINAKVNIETARKTAELMVEIDMLRKKLEEYENLVHDFNMTLYDKLRKIIQLLSRGWKFTMLDGEPHLVYPEIKVKYVKRGDKMFEIPEEKRKFYIKNLIVPIGERLTELYAVEAYHPNVLDESNWYLGKDVYRVCIGDLSGKNFDEIVYAVVDMLETANLSSAFANAATDEADEIFDELKNDENALSIKIEWEV